MLLPALMLYLSVAALFGLVGGYLFHRLWRRIAPSPWAKQCLRSALADAGRMISCDDPAEIFGHYMTFFRSISKYVGRSSAGLLVGLAPVSGLFLLLASFDPSGQLAPRAEVAPSAAIGAVKFHEDILVLSGDRVFIQTDKVGKSGIMIGGAIFDAAMLKGRHALCSSSISCVLLQAMLFESHRMPADAKSAGTIVVRPAIMDRNPLWPYFGDSDLVFFVSIIFGTSVAALAKPRRQRSRG